MSPLRLGIFASHHGRTMQSILDACRNGTIEAVPGVIISNNRDAVALRRADAAGIPNFLLNTRTHPDDEDRDRQILQILLDHDVHLVILAGYMKKIGPATLEHYRGHILNSHPALLPKHGGRGMYGMFVHEAVLAAGEQESGVTIHVVDEEYDHGPIVAQRTVPVYPSDDASSLRDRVLGAEKELYVETIDRISRGQLL